MHNRHTLAILNLSNGRLIMLVVGGRRFSLNHSTARPFLVSAYLLLPFRGKALFVEYIYVKTYRAGFYNLFRGKAEYSIIIRA